MLIKCDIFYCNYHFRSVRWEGNQTYAVTVVERSYLILRCPDRAPETVYLRPGTQEVFVPFKCTAEAEGNWFTINSPLRHMAKDHLVKPLFLDMKALVAASSDPYGLVWKTYLGSGGIAAAAAALLLALVGLVLKSKWHLLVDLLIERVLEKHLPQPMKQTF